MVTNSSSNFCPYKGLQPYTAADRAYFFGRERDQEIIASNLYAAPLTILYGASGVGKTSVLLAGVVPQLRQTPRLAVVVFRAWQDGSFLTALKTQTLAEMQQRAEKPMAIDIGLPFDDFVRACASALRGNLFFILDQFEEYFLYHPPTPDESGFDAEFARAVNRREVAANFLLALREDSLSRFDRFKGRIPNLLGNMLRLEHLDRCAAVSAIRNPLAEYNRQFTPPKPWGIEDSLLENVIEQVRAGSVALGAGGIGQIVASDELRVETPYLQLVMTRLWDEERRAGSNLLRRATFDRLGGAQQICRTHLDTTMARLAGAEREIAARAFRYLVTPSQTKIAFTLPDLADFAAVPQTKLEPVLRKLAEPDVRVLRSIAPAAGEKKQVRYEIFHDVLAPAVLDWRDRYQEQSRNNRVRAFIAIVVPIILLALAFSVVQSFQAQAQVQQARVEVQATQTQVNAVQATQVQVSAEQIGVRATQAKVEATQTVFRGDTGATQTVQAASTLAQQVVQATRAAAGKTATVSQQVLRTPSPPAAVQTAAVGAAQALDLKVTDVRVEISPTVLAACPTTMTLQAMITVNHPGLVEYRWESSDGAALPSNKISFPVSGTKTVVDTWVINYLTTGSVYLRISVPNEFQSNPARFMLRSALVPTSLQSALEKNPKVAANLGCSQGSVSKTINGALQMFQNGLMLWREDEARIYVLPGDDRWQEYRDTWDPSQKESGGLKPPSGLYEPQRGFGKVWRERLGGEKANIGWAMDPRESAVKLQIQQFERGFAVIINDGKDIKVLFRDGKWMDL